MAECGYSRPQRVVTGQSPCAPQQQHAASLRAQRRRPRRGCAPPGAFMPALDMPSPQPGWVMPSWLAVQSDSPRDAVRQQRLRQLRGLLSVAQSEPPLLLPQHPDDGPPSPGAEDGGGSLHLSHSASNAVPFHTPAAVGGPAPASPGASCRAEAARQVLPWLYCVEGRLDFSAMESLASQLALTGLQLLDVSRFVAASTSAGGHWHNCWGGHVRWAGAQTLPSPAVAAAAALRRMELRRGGALHQLQAMDGKAVVLAFQPQHRQMAAEALALYLHAYIGVSGQEAVQVAGAAVGASPLSATLRQLLEELAVIAEGWTRRVTLAWPYAGGHVEVVGDAVGGWEQRAPMVFDVKRKRWRLQIWGLPPGVHRFKFLVDGQWVIDLAAHTESDHSGNINNVIMVTSAGRPLGRPLTSDDSEEEAEGADGGPGAASSGDGNPSALVAATGAGEEGAHALAAGVLATRAEPPVQPETADGRAATAAAAQSQPWRSTGEMESMARFGAAVMAFHTRLGVQLRHVFH